MIWSTLQLLRVNSWINFVLESSSISWIWFKLANTCCLGFSAEADHSVHVYMWVSSWYTMMSVRSVLSPGKLAAHLMTEGECGNPYFSESTRRDLAFDYTFTLVLDAVIPLWNCLSWGKALCDYCVRFCWFHVRLLWYLCTSNLWLWMVLRTALGR